jgi:hypothetical protein
MFQKDTINSYGNYYYNCIDNILLKMVAKTETCKGWKIKKTQLDGVIILYTTVSVTHRDELSQKEKLEDFKSPTLFQRRKTLKMEVHSSETPVNFYQTIRCHPAKDRIINSRC